MVSILEKIAVANCPENLIADQTSLLIKKQNIINTMASCCALLCVNSLDSVAVCSVYGLSYVVSNCCVIC